MTSLDTSIKEHLAGTLDGTHCLDSLSNGPHGLCLPRLVKKAHRLSLLPPKTAIGSIYLRMELHAVKYEANTGHQVPFTLEMSGYFVFSQLNESLTGININPFTDRAIHYLAHQIPNIVQMADGLILDEILHGKMELPDAPLTGSKDLMRTTYPLAWWMGVGR